MLLSYCYVLLLITTNVNSRTHTHPANGNRANLLFLCLFELFAAVSKEIPRTYLSKAESEAQVPSICDAIHTQTHAHAVRVLALIPNSAAFAPRTYLMLSMLIMNGLNIDGLISLDMTRNKCFHVYFRCCQMLCSFNEKRNVTDVFHLMKTYRAMEPSPAPIDRIVVRLLLNFRRKVFLPADLSCSAKTIG